MGKMNWERSKKLAERTSEQREVARAVRLRKPAQAKPPTAWDPVNARAGGRGGPVRRLTPEEIAAQYPKG